MNSSRRSHHVQVVSIAIRGDRFTGDIFHHEVRPTVRAVPASNTRAMFGWSISAKAWRSCSNRAMTARVHAGLDDLHRDATLHRFDLIGNPDRAESAFTNHLKQLVRADALRHRSLIRRRRHCDGRV